MSFFGSFQYRPLRPRATEAQLERIYHAAKMGLGQESIAHAVGLVPADYLRLRELDPSVEMAEDKGRAEGELEMADALYTAARCGEHKAAIDFLKHKYGWVSKTQVDVQVDQRISISQALDMARKRVIDAEFTEVEDQRTPLQIAKARAIAATDDDYEDDDE